MRTRKSLSKPLQTFEQSIYQAFQDVPCPLPEQLVVPTNELDQQAADQTRKFFAGKNWRKLSWTFLNKKWSGFGYFTKEAFQYYLPALLVHAVEPFSEQNELLYSAMYRLTPSFYRLFWGQGKDSFFDYQTSALTQEQYAVVAEFLRQILEGKFDLIYRYFAARAIRWGWSREATPARVASQAFYYQLYNYTYPAAKKKSDRVLIDHITQAFSQTPMPLGEHLTESEQTDKPYENSMEFQGTLWNKLHPDFVAYHSSALAFFTPAAFRYYIPAYMVAEIHGVQGDADPVFYLVRGFTEDFSPNREKRIRQMSLFSQEERSAIVAYLESHLTDKSQRADIDKALQSYWRTKVTKSTN